MIEIRGQKSEVRKPATLSALRFALSVVSALLFALCLPAEAQQASRVHRIGVLVHTDAGFPRDVFLQGLAEFGYVEGRNITIEYRSADGKVDRFPDLAGELIRLKSHVIVASSNPAITALKQATQDIPIVMTTVGDPVGAGFIQSLARPGGNITGLTNVA
jgi:putative ABC transport system substrate-binding protein